MDAGPADSGLALSIAVPLYVDPPVAPATWTQLNGAAPAVSLLVANPNSGPGSSADSSYTAAIAATHSAGQKIIGYVHTSQGQRALSDVAADINAWYSFYPAIDGIFFDEVSTDPSTVPEYYQPLHDAVKGKPGADLVVLNPGTATAEAFMTTADIIVTFEDTYAHYLSGGVNASWTTGYPPSRFWNLILSATSQAEMENAITLAAQRNVGTVFVTDQGAATAYQTIPSGSYWLAEVAAVQSP